MKSAEQPAFGIEIELPWQHMLRRVDSEAADILRARSGYSNIHGSEQTKVQAAMDEVDRRYKDRVKRALARGIDEGRDGYVEFAHKPRFDTDEIIAEVGQLYDEGILRNDESYPLHVTVGGIEQSAASGYLIASAEIVGDIDPQRIRNQSTWAVKGRAGLKTRALSELQLGHTTGVEMRTLQVHSLEQLDLMLRVIKLGAYSIVSTGQSTWQPALNDHMTHAGLPNQYWNRFSPHWDHYADLLQDNAWNTAAKAIITHHVN